MTRDPFTDSPFAHHREKTIGNHGAALRLQRIVLNLYNGQRWPILKDELGGYLSNADHDHRIALLAMLEWYAVHGENDPDFMSLGRELAQNALRAEDWNTGYTDGFNHRDRRNHDNIANGYVEDYADGFKNGADDRQQHDSAYIR